MNAPVFLAAAAANANESELVYVWDKPRLKPRSSSSASLLFSILAWSVMIAKAVQMSRAKKLNRFFNAEYRTQKNVLDVFDRRVQADGCPHVRWSTRPAASSWTRG